MTALRCRALALGFVAAAALGTSYPSTSSAATVPVGCGPADLIAAIETVNSTPGSDTLQLAQSCVYTFTTPYSSGSGYASWYGPSALPAIASDITIEGNGATIRRDAAATAPFRLFFVGADPADPDTFDYDTPGSGSLTLRDVILRGGLARGGNSAVGGGGAGLGGAIFSQGEVTLSRTTIADSTARGGSSGVPGLGSGGGGIGADATGNEGAGFGGGLGFGGGSGGSGDPGGGGGGGGGFRASDDGSTASTTAGADGGGAATGLGGSGGGGQGAGGNGSGGGGSSSNSGVSGGAGGGFGGGGGGGGFPWGSGGGGGVGGGGGAPFGGGGGGGFGGGGGYGDDGGGTGGFGGGGGGGGGGDPGGSGGFGGGAGSSAADGGGGAGMGGAIFNHQGELTVQNSTLSQNSALGGGVWATGSGQIGSGLGGAIFNLNGALTLDSATVAFNTADAGGAVYSLGYLAADTGAPIGHAYSAESTPTNSIFADSTAGSDVFVNRPATVSGGSSNTATSTADASDHNLVESVATVGGATLAGSPLTDDPGLGSLADNGGQTPTHAITDASPAFDAGATTLATDQRSISRPQGAADDIGAFELAIVASPSLSVTASPNIALGGQAHGAATLAGGSIPTGQITFNLYGPDAADCSGPAVFTDTRPVNGNGVYNSATFTPTHAGAYRWTAEYAGDTGNAPASSDCDSPAARFTVSSAGGGGETSPEEPPPEEPPPADPPRGTDGADILDGTDLADLIDGLAGDDVIRGLAGDDRLIGSDGADRIKGGDGDDLVRGGKGPDRLNGESGKDRVFGGRGKDRISAYDSERDEVNCGKGVDTVIADDVDAIGESCEKVR